MTSRRSSGSRCGERTLASPQNSKVSWRRSAFGWVGGSGPGTAPSLFGLAVWEGGAIAASVGIRPVFLLSAALIGSLPVLLALTARFGTSAVRYPRLEL